MAAIFAFTCTCCGKTHEGSPSIAFDSPWHYASLSKEQKASMGDLSSDFCKITHDAGIDYFIRTVLEVPIQGVGEPFTWGVWVSLSEKSFARYVEVYDNPVEGDGFFGWLCNRLPCYNDTISLPTDVVVQLGGTRPTLRLHQSGDVGQHQLVIDQCEGVSIARAQEIAEHVTHGT